MKKFLTGLRYGNWLTKLYVISIPICILVGIVLIVLSFVWNVIYLFLLGVAFGIGAIALSQSFTIGEEFIEQEPEEEKNQTTKQLPRKKTQGKSEARKTLEESQELEKETVKESRRVEPETQEPETEIKESEEKEKKKENKKPKQDELEEYDEKKIKQVFYKYKVRKEHRMIMIDEWKEREIHQQPAYIWVHRGQVHLLIIGDDVQELTVPVNKASSMLYQRGIVCQTKEEYPQFRKESLLSTLFSPYLPVYHEGNKNGRPVIYKNLFEFGSGIKITNTSARNVRDLLQSEVQVDDIVTRDLRYNSFFKEIYKTGILFREQVITAKEYQDQVNDVLQNLALSDASDKEYEDTLQLLCHQKLISQEYMEYYKQYRVRVRLEEEEKKNGRNHKKDKQKKKTKEQKKTKK